MEISIITITYNAEECIARTIESVLNQTKNVYEYILADGGSKDKTNDIIESYRRYFEEKGIKFVHNSEPDKGISDAFNKGIKKASGELIGLINADDELLSDACENLSSIKNATQYDVIYGNCIWVDLENRIEYVKKPKHNLEQLYYNLVLIHPSTFVKKVAYEKYGLFNIEYHFCMDKELLLRMYKNGARFFYIDKVLTKFKAGGVSDTNIIKTVNEGIRLATDNGKLWINIYINAFYKVIKFEISVFLKKTKLYRRIKENVKDIR